MPDSEKEANKSRAEARKIMKNKYPDLTRHEIVHHIDCNPFNNDISNLVVMPLCEHASLHWSLPQTRERAKNSRLNNSLDRNLSRLDSLLTVYNIF